MFCEKCGKELHEGASFCSFCGLKVELPVSSIPEDKIEEPTKIEISPVQEEQPASSSSVVKKILSGIGTVVSFLLFATAAVIGKEIAHNGSAARVISYTLPGILTGCVVAGILCAIYSNRQEKTSMAPKVIMWCVSIGAGLLAGIYGAIFLGILGAIIIVFYTRK